MEAKFRDIPEALWEQVAPLIPVRRKKTLRGRPPVPNRDVLAGIVYRLRTGCQWKALPQDFGSGSTCHRRFQEWCAAGVITEIFSELLKFYDRKRGIQWKWSSLDTAMVKAPKGGTSPAPTPRTARKVASNATS
jgi:putative transposase